MEKSVSKYDMQLPFHLQRLWQLTPDQGFSIAIKSLFFQIAKGHKGILMVPYL